MDAKPATRILKSDDDLTHDQVKGISTPPRPLTCGERDSCWNSCGSSTTPAWWVALGCVCVSKKNGCLSVSCSTVVLRRNFAGHLQFLTWPLLLHCVESGHRLPQENTPGQLADLRFGALDLVDEFYQLGWIGLSSSFCVDVRVRSWEVGASEVVLDDVVKPGEHA